MYGHNKMMNGDYVISTRIYREFHLYLRMLNVCNFWCGRATELQFLDNKVQSLPIFLIHLSLLAVLFFDE